MSDEADKKPSARDHFSRPSIKVDGYTLVCDIESELSIDDVDEGMRRAASLMGFWASVWAAAVEQQVQVDAHYRAWRADTTKAILERDPKIAEWKVKSEIESHPKFLHFKHGIAAAERAVTLARGMFDSAEARKGSLQSRGAMMRDEVLAHGMSTPANPRRRAHVADEGGDIDTDAVDVDKEPPPIGTLAATPSGKVSAMKKLFKNKVK